MSMLHHGDAHLHYSDNSHRWIAPPDIEQGAWEAGMRAHLSLHRTTMGGPPTVEETHESRPLFVPARRTAAPTPKKTVIRRVVDPIRQLPRAG